MGRKKVYDENTFPLLAEKYAREGLNDKQISTNLGIGLSAYYDYQNTYPEFSKAIKRGKRPVDIEVENALYKRAIGYTYTETHKEVRYGLDGVAKPSVTKTVVKNVPPDVGAIAFWLKNRRPDEWRERQDHNVSITKEQPLFPDVSTDDSDK